MTYADPAHARTHASSRASSVETSPSPDPSPLLRLCYRLRSNIVPDSLLISLPFLSLLFLFFSFSLVPPVSIYIEALGDRL